MTDNSAAAVLRAVLELGPVPRSVVARHVGVSPATVTWQSRSLLEAGLLVELPEAVSLSGIGRPYSPLALNSAGNVVIAVHIAAAQTTVAVVDIAGKVLSGNQIPHRSFEPDDILADAGDAIAAVRDAGDGHRVLAVGVAIGGRVDRSAGVVREHSFLRWHDVPVRARLAAATGLPVELDSHARALMHAEQLFGRLRGTSSAVMLFVGNVIDAAFAVHGRVHYGPRSSAGSISRLAGGAEASRDDYSDHALLRRAAAAAIPARTIPELLAAAGTDPAAHELFVQRAAALGRIVAMLVDILDPEAVVIVDRSLPELPAVRESYVETVRGHSVTSSDPDELIAASTFMGQVLETAGAAVALDGLFRAPLDAMERWTADLPV
ncbi:ROK family transcriptional regulator [Nocardia sp. NPDC050697]|uniref:ROK family transcriptional regulator n=1 Tax=Nocardia sp. NPDC050697 TaxID=3155158 RepID=UPI00340DDF0D